MANTSENREGNRLQRQFARLKRDHPRLGSVLYRLSRPGWSVIRVPVGMLFILGGVLSILPVLGLWMIPVGLLLLAVDVPWLRRPVSGGMIRLRRRADKIRFRKRPSRLR